MTLPGKSSGGKPTPKRKAPPGKPVWVKSHWRRKVYVRGHHRKRPEMPF